MKLKKIIPVILMIVFLSGCISQPVPNHKLEYNGISTTFRADITKALLVPVYSDEVQLKDLLLNKNISSINVTFIANDSENKYYAVGAFEIGYKLSLVKQKENLNYTVNATEILSLDDMIPLENTVYVFLAGPSQANETRVDINISIITVSARNLEKPYGKYTDLDLSIDKMLLSVMMEQED